MVFFVSHPCTKVERWECLHREYCASPIVCMLATPRSLEGRLYIVYYIPDIATNGRQSASLYFYSAKSGWLLNPCRIVWITKNENEGGCFDTVASSCGWLPKSRENICLPLSVICTRYKRSLVLRGNFRLGSHQRSTFDFCQFPEYYTLI